MASEQDTMISLPVMGDLTYREWHGVVDGFYIGVVDGDRNHDYEQEQHYWRTGYLIGRALSETADIVRAALRIDE